MMKKDFTTDKLGMYGDPEGNFVITGGSNVSRTPITTKYLQDQIIATTADGTTKMLPPGVKNIELPSNTVLEMKYQMGAQVNDQQQQLMQLISAYCQVVGGGDNSCAEKVAQSLQKNPEKMIQQMTATIQQAQQEQGMQQEEGEEEDEMRDGGCLDCQEQFPQAQNLNWFYKAQGGEAFPQANTYPESWASYSGNQYAGGGEAFPQANVYPHMYFDGGITEVFPQAQTYLPYDRPGETRLNGMFQKGGTLYDYVKSMGMDPSYQSRKKLFGQFFDEPYTGTAEQNIYLLNALKTGKVTLAERPKLGSVGFPASESFFNQQESRPTKSTPSKAAPTKSAPVKSTPARSYNLEVPGVITSQRDSPRMTSPLVGIPTAPAKRSVLPKAEQAQKEADKRAIPQTGVIVDKRSGEAVVLGPGGATTFPVLTGRNVEGNVNPYGPDNTNPEYMATPTGYYMMSDTSLSGQPMLRDLFEGNVGTWLNPIPAYGVSPAVANFVGMHGTYDPEVRNQLYTASPDRRNVSMGCVNCGPTDFQHMMGTLGGPDTVMVVDSKRPEDSRLFNQAKQQAEFRMNPRNQYSVVATEPRGYITTGYEYGGQTLQEVYQMMKRGGLNYNPKKKKGKQETFEQYMMRMGGLSKAAVGGPFGGDDNDYADDEYGDPGDVSGSRRDARRENRMNRWWNRRTARDFRDQQTYRDMYNRNVPPGSDEGADYDQARGDGFPTVTLDEKGNMVTPQLKYPIQQQASTGQPGTGQQQQQNQGFGPGSQYDLTVRQRQAADPFAAYTGGRNLTNMFGSKFGAGMSILNAMGATANSFGGGKSRFKTKTFGPGRELLDKTKASGAAADIAAAGMFGNMFPQQQATRTAATTQSPRTTSPAQSYIDQQLPILKQLQRPETQGGFRFAQSGGQGNTQFKYTFSDPTQMNVGAGAFSAGVGDQLSMNRMEELREQMMNRGAMSTAPITTATKTQAGSPQGAVNAPSFVTPTVEASRATDAFLPQQLMYAQMGGDMLDQFEDDEEIDLSDMTPQEQQAFINAIYAAGGSVEFM